MVKDNNYITIQGWMLNKLHLKNLELLVYAIIYGFSQINGHYFQGSISYLQEWTGASKNGVLNALKSLQDKGLLEKEECWPINKYQAIDPTSDGANSAINSAKNVPDGAKNRLPSTKTERNNIEYNLDNNIDYNIDICSATTNSSAKDTTDVAKNDSYNVDNDYSKVKAIYEAAETIVSYLNKKCNTKYKANTAATLKLIKARLKEGFTVDDFKKVVDNKYEDWGAHPTRFSNGVMSSTYLRPTTLFANNFESYLNEQPRQPVALNESKFYSESKSCPMDDSTVYYEDEAF